MKRTPGTNSWRARATACAALAGAFGFSSEALAMGPFERNQAKVEEGLKAYAAGHYDQALEAFDAAKQELPSNAAVEFDRGNALYKLGRLDEAQAAYRHVQELDRGDLRAKDYYNLGNSQAQLGNRDEAIRAYRRALSLNPEDNDARHNLEVVLKDMRPPKNPPPDGGADGGTDGGHQDGGRDGGQDAGSPRDGGMDGGADGGAGDGGAPDGGAGDGGRRDGGSSSGPNAHGDGGADAGSDAGAAQPSPSDGADGGKDAGAPEAEQPLQDPQEDGGVAHEARITKDDAERLLDSMKQNEKNLQLWRFQQKKRPRKPNEKDW